MLISEVAHVQGKISFEVIALGLFTILCTFARFYETRAVFDAYHP
jgi:hypothetical protein